MGNILRKLQKIRTPYIWANPRNDCIGCWRCIDVCPKDVFGKHRFLWHKRIYIKNAASCIGCKKCIKICPKDIFSETMPDLLKSVLLKKGVDLSQIDVGKNAEL
jgi:ferredoxin